MAKHIFLIIATASLISPIGAYAAQLNPKTNNSQVLKPVMKQQLAQYHLAQGKRHSRGDRMNEILQQLNLTAEQSQQIEAVNQEFRSSYEALKQEMQNNRQEKRASFAIDASTEELRQQHQSFQALQQQLGDNRFEMMLQVREVLTPEQRRQLAELMEQKRN